MKKPILISIVLSLLLSACSMEDLTALLLTPTPVGTSAPESSATPAMVGTPLNTPTATIIPSFTPTPTIVGGNAVATETLTPFVPTFDVVEARPVVLMSGNSMFLTVGASTDTIVWGSHCEGPRYIDFSAGVAGLNVDYVLLFLHLEDKFSGYSTPWGAGAIMQRDKITGKYNYHVTYEQLPNYRDFEDAWVVFQIVASTYSLKRLGATTVYDREISLKHCPVPWQE